jgi:hypothetical protein
MEDSHNSLSKIELLLNSTDMKESPERFPQLLERLSLNSGAFIVGVMPGRRA